MPFRSVVRGTPVVLFRLLGPVGADAAGEPVDVGHPRQRCVLAVLLVDASRVVSQDALVDRVWGDDPPESARRVLHSHLSRVRRLLDQVAAQHEVPVALQRRPGGYVLEVAPELVDLHQFRGLVAKARGSGSDRVELLRTALGLWRGEPLGGVPGEWAARTRQTLRGEWMAAAEEWARIELELGNAERVVGPLTGVLDDNPLVEPVAALLVRALARSGRPTEALSRYTRTRDLLVAELGFEPGPELRAAQREVLQRDEEPAAAQSRPVPRQLPAVAPLFTGREMELAELDKIHDASTVVITAIDGMAGVGKTALAVRAAHQMADRYPDGQLFLDLHGYTDGVAPIDPGAALDWMLRSLGVPGERIPADVELRAGLYRSRLADLRMVIVLDNAVSEAQVGPLLPGSPGCVVLVTSRRRLAGLDHTHALSVDTLPLPDAVALLSMTAGEHRLAGQPPDLAAELVELCGRLPLAIRIATARLRSHPAWDLADLAARLRDQRHRLAELEAGQRSVTAALDLSYQDLGAVEQRTYRRLGLHPGPDLDPYAAAALLDATLPQAGRMLEQLLEAHLLQELTTGRYRFHDLTRAHAAHAAARDENQQDGQAALDRLLDHYRHTAAMAMDTAYPYEREYRPQVPPARTPSPDLSDPAEALGWVDRELPNMLATARYATDHQRPVHVLHLSTTLHRHLRTRGPYHDAETLHHQALTTARAVGNQAGALEALIGLGHIHRLQGRHGQAAEDHQEALQLARASGHQAAELQALVGLGLDHRKHGRHDQATDHYQQALLIARATSHHAAEMEALTGLGHVHRMQGRYEQATENLAQALRLARATGNPEAEQAALTGLGNMYHVQGRYVQAADHLAQGLQLARATGNRTGELNALTSLGQIHRMQGWHERATEDYQQALQLARTTGSRELEQAALTGIGEMHRLQGRYEQAAEHYQRLLDLAIEAGSRNFQFEAWQGLGRLHLSTGHPSAALTHHEKALALATELGQPDDQARAHDGLARARRALHQHEQARTHWQHALDILSSLGMPQADEEATVAAIRAHLAPEEGESIVDS